MTSKLLFHLEICSKNAGLRGVPFPIIAKEAMTVSFPELQFYQLFSLPTRNRRVTRNSETGLHVLPTLFLTASHHTGFPYILCCSSAPLIIANASLKKPKPGNNTRKSSSQVYTLFITVCMKHEANLECANQPKQGWLLQSTRYVNYKVLD